MGTSHTAGFKVDCGGYKPRSPFISARNKRRLARKQVGLSSVGRASGFDPGCHSFESSSPCQLTNK